jgi:hypothetical protein
MNKTAVSMLIAIAVVTPQAQQHTESEAEIDQHVLAGLLDASKEQCELASAAVEELARVLAQAKRERDLNKLRAALITADGSLREARQHLGSCQDEMKLIGRSSSRPSVGTSGLQPAAGSCTPSAEQESNDPRHK